VDTAVAGKTIASMAMESIPGQTVASTKEALPMTTEMASEPSSGQMGVHTKDNGLKGGSMDAAFSPLQRGSHMKENGSREYARDGSLLDHLTPREMRMPPIIDAPIRGLLLSCIALAKVSKVYPL
ncbi:hypothetical protein FOZ63_023922, partial [Perkinsus olseni]